MIGTTGTYATACGTTVLPAASQDPPQPDCPGCRRYVTAWHNERTITQRFGTPRTYTKLALFHSLISRCRR